MTTVGCDAGLTSTTFHGSPLNPLLCSSCIVHCAQTKAQRLVLRKEKQWYRPPMAFILTFRLCFGIKVSLRIRLYCLLNTVNSHKTTPEHKYQLCQNQEVDGAATTLINLSIALQEVGGEDERDTDWECRHTECDDISMVSRRCLAEDISDSEAVKFFFFFFLPLGGA